MACDLTLSLSTLPCKDNISGIRAIYFANYIDVPNFVFTSADTGHIMTDIGDLTAVYKYAVKNDGNTFVEALAGDNNTGTNVATQTLTAILLKVSKIKQYQLKVMTLGHPFCFVELNIRRRKRRIKGVQNEQ